MCCWRGFVGFSGVEDTSSLKKIKPVELLRVFGVQDVLCSFVVRDSYGFRGFGFQVCGIFLTLTLGQNLATTAAILVRRTLPSC